MIVVDVAMPVLNGFDAIRELKKAGAHRHKALISLPVFLLIVARCPMTYIFPDSFIFAS